MSAVSNGQPSAASEVTVMLPPTTPSRETSILAVRDSMVRRAIFTVPLPRYLTIASRDGLSWAKGREWIREQVIYWRDMTLATGRRLGAVFIWAGGNDEYPGRGGRRPSFSIRELASLVGELAVTIPEIALVGPTQGSHGKWKTELQDFSRINIIKFPGL